MNEFKSIMDAQEYATRGISKYNSEIAMVEGKPSFLCCTGIPLEERLRAPIENAVLDFLNELGVDDSEDLAVDIGAEVCSTLIDVIEKRANVNIICPWLDY